MFRKVLESILGLRLKSVAWIVSRKMPMLKFVDEGQTTTGPFHDILSLSHAAKNQAPWQVNANSIEYRWLLAHWGTQWSTVPTHLVSLVKSERKNTKQTSPSWCFTPIRSVQPMYMHKCYHQHSWTPHSLPSHKVGPNCTGIHNNGRLKPGQICDISWTPNTVYHFRK